MYLGKQNKRPVIKPAMSGYVTTVRDIEKLYKVSPSGALSPFVDTPATARVARLGGVSTGHGDYINATQHIYTKDKEEHVFGNYNFYDSFSPFQAYRAVGPLDNRFSMRIDTANIPSANAVFNSCVARLYDKIRNSDSNLAIDVAEHRQTQRMLGKAWSGIPKVVDYAKKAKKRQRPGMTLDEARAAIRNGWLSYTYGWRPLLQTIYALATFERSKLGVRAVRARSKQECDVKIQGGGGLLVPWNYVTHHSVRYEIYLVYRVADPNLYDLTRITSLNPLAIAWELVPYSFVVDWFIDLGGYMQAWEGSAFMGLTFLRGYKTKTTRSVTVGNYSGKWTPAGFTRGPFTINAKWKNTSSSLGRNRLTSPPRPEVPHLKLSLGWQRLASAAALIDQILTPDSSILRK